MAIALVLTVSALGGRTAFVPPHAQKDSALLASVLRGLKTDLVSVTLGPQPARHSASAKSTWLYVTHNAGQTLAGIDEDAWYAYLIAGAYGAQCSARGADCLDGYVFEGSNGPVEGDSSERIGFLEAVTQSSATPQELSATIERRLAAEGITDASISFGQPDGLAAIVEAKSSDPQATINRLNTGKVFSGLGLDGYLMRIVDSSGETVSLETVANRLQSGQGYLKPGLTAPNVP